MTLGRSVRLTRRILAQRSIDISLTLITFDSNLFSSYVYCKLQMFLTRHLVRPGGESLSGQRL